MELRTALVVLLVALVASSLADGSFYLADFPPQVTWAHSNFITKLPGETITGTVSFLYDSASRARWLSANSTSSDKPKLQFQEWIQYSNEGLKAPISYFFSDWFYFLTALTNKSSWKGLIDLIIPSFPFTYFLPKLRTSIVSFPIQAPVLNLFIRMRL